MHIFKFLAAIVILIFQLMTCNAAGYKHVAEHDPQLPQYSYAYGVNDPSTGDIKAHAEERNGDFVRGEYSLIDPDGYRRIVQYVADANNGFQAIVRREPIQEQLRDFVADYPTMSPAYLSAPSPFRVPLQ